MRKKLGIFALMFFFFYMLLSYGCATTKVEPEPPCVKGEIYFGVDHQAWKHLRGAGFKARPIYIYECLGNDEGDALNSEAFYDGQRYRLYEKQYRFINSFESFSEMKAFIERKTKPKLGPRK